MVRIADKIDSSGCDVALVTKVPGDVQNEDTAAKHVLLQRSTIRHAGLEGGVISAAEYRIDPDDIEATQRAYRGAHNS